MSSSSSHSNIALTSKSIQYSLKADAMRATPIASTVSPAQLYANRANAALSTGPTSAAGKAIVSQNRTTHGLNYNAATFRVLPCEDQADYDRLLASLEADHQPANPTEALLVTSMAQHRWLLDRATRLQETCFDPETGKVADQKLFSLYLRYATTHERAFHKCLSTLVNNRIQAQKTQIGFESETRRAERHKHWQICSVVYQGMNELKFHNLEHAHLLQKTDPSLRQTMKKEA